MDDKNNCLEPLPDSFQREEDAGAFWDTHSTSLYENYFQSTDDVIEIRDRVFEVQIAEDVVQKLLKEASSLQQAVPKVLDEILRKQLP